MKIEAFDYIKRATKELNAQKAPLETAAAELSGYLQKIFESSDDAVSFISRIKTADSLREKIIRNELYKKYDLNKMFESLSDIIGVRIGCRFLKDEKGIYERLKRHFFLENEYGLNYHPDNPNICLKLCTQQPERQHNGFDIYRIDGYVINGKKYRFELQIKSLINNFWSDIEHKIIYKNKRYLGGDNFIRDLMNSIYANLVNIDMQLSMLFDRSVDRSNTEFFAQTENIITVMMDELSSELVEYKTGIAVNMNEYSQSLVHYILTSSSFKKASDKNQEIYSGVVMNLISRLQSIEFMQIPIGEEIALPQNIEYGDELQKVCGEKFRSEVNSDFFVNTFFHILFSLETGNDLSDFLSFVSYFADNFRKVHKDMTEKEVIELAGNSRPQKLICVK